MGYCMVEQPEVVNNVQVPQIQYIDRVVDIPAVDGRWRFLFSRGLCVLEVSDVRIELISEGEVGIEIIGCGAC